MEFFFRDFFNYKRIQCSNLCIYQKRVHITYSSVIEF
jgi:hypothetical protein